MFNNLFKKNEESKQTSLLNKTIDSDIARLKKASTNLLIAPLKLLCDIISNAFWVILGFAICSVIIAFTIPQIREVVVNIIVNWLEKI